MNVPGCKRPRVLLRRVHMDREIKERNMVMQVILYIITFGIYGIYWFYVSTDEMKTIARDDEASPILWTILIFVPIAFLYSFYKYCELFQKISAEHLNMWILFLLWIVFPPAVWFIAQLELNKHSLTQEPSRQLVA